MGTGAFFVWNILRYHDLVGTDVPEAGYFVGVGFTWWYLSDSIVVGFGLKWGRWPQIAVIPIVLVLVAASLVADEGIWGPPLGWGVFIMVQFWYGFIAPSFLLAAIFAVPG